MNDNTGNDRPEDDAILAAENEGMDEAIGHPNAHASAPNPQINPFWPSSRRRAGEGARRAEGQHVLRALAESDNVRKRANRQIEEARLYAVEKFARDLLNVSDNLARAVDSVRPKAAVAS
jgi:molecular chaperone GrpE (heat shock protein)